MISLKLPALLLLSFLPAAAAEKPAQPTRASVLAAMRSAADWQLAHPDPNPKFRPDGWVNAAFYTGAMALAKLVPDDPTYVDAMVKMGEKNGWHLGPRVYHADDQAVGATYAMLYQLDPKPERIWPTRNELDYILQHPSTATLSFTDPKHSERWSWCDSLFMAPTVWARVGRITHDPKYLAYVDREWWQTSEHLYDKDEHLFYRDDRFFTIKEPNGAKMFWARGNGWVLAGLARLIPLLPADDPARPKYVKQFRQMAARIKGLQLPNGTWPAGLLDPAAYPQEEISGTGFFCFALGWGINHGLLDREEYQPAVLKAWAALNRHIAADGRLDSSQPGGDRPVAFPPADTEPYGVGAFLLAGSEVYHLVGKDKK